MIVAKCKFKNAYGYSKPYHYAISRKMAEEIEPKSHVVVSNARDKYVVAKFIGIETITDPMQIDFISQHVVCEIKDQYQEETNDK